jgi:pimeloyl-ACP methyl ester carboxylesterase
VAREAAEVELSGSRQLVTDTSRSAPVVAPVVAALLVAFTACAGPTRAQEEPMIDTTEPVFVAGTALHVEERGEGPPLLLVHGGGEDSTMLAGQAESLAAAGYRVITYDRRGTGRSGRAAWPGNGADQHADDAAALLATLDAAPATVLGVSSGGVVALALAARHPEAVARVIAWEPPASGVLPGAAAINDAIMAPVEAHLRAHPGDYVGAQALLLTMILDIPVSPDAPEFAAARANAEPMIRDEPAITLRPFTADELTAVPVTIAVGTEPNELIRAATAVLGELTGSAPEVVEGVGHEVYLSDPAVLTGLVAAART